MPPSNEDKRDQPRQEAQPRAPKVERVKGLRLVSEARPIPWNRLSKFEQGQLRDADRWMKAVRTDASQAKPASDEIDRLRSGRVLFIDGPRGAGKTSLLLTLLERWQGNEPYTKLKQGFKNLRVLLPILDFDPLPRGMPLHGWLLEPWRIEVRRLEREAGACADGKELSELWADVFERAVLGWSQATVDGKGVVEKALAYSEQASGWIDLRNRWYELVNTAVCRSVRCLSTTCKAAHEFVFVISIDDVDLQVEQVPQLLHATRLLHHPNVAYVLTGDREHLRFVLELEYLRRHGTSHRLVDRSVDREYSKTIVSYSRTLRDALLEKALPQHATLKLPALSLEAVLRMHVGGDDDKAALTVSGMLDNAWQNIATEMKDLGVVTARRAQHAIDKYLHTSRRRTNEAPATKDAQLRFIVDLCGVIIDERRRVLLRGRLTTLLGDVFQTWEGDRLSIQLRDQPPFAFQPQFDEADSRVGDEANRAAIIRFVIEQQLAGAPGLVWAPDAGVATTEVRWHSDVAGIDGIALFHWPWLVRPTVSEVLQLGDVAEQMRKQAGDVSDRSHLDQKMILVWLRKNVEWQYQRKELAGAPCPGLTSLKDIVIVLKALCGQANDLVNLEAHRWVGELVVMSAPYFGLPESVASSLYDELEHQGLVPDLEDLLREERRMVENAVFTWQLG